MKMWDPFEKFLKKIFFNKQHSKFSNNIFYFDFVKKIFENEKVEPFRKFLEKIIFNKQHLKCLNNIFVFDFWKKKIF